MNFESFALQFIQEDAKNTQNDGAKWNSIFAPLYDRLRARARKQDGEVVEPIEYGEPVMSLERDMLVQPKITSDPRTRDYDATDNVKKVRKTRAKKESKTSDSVG